jgi:hypothetical protein
MSLQSLQPGGKKSSKPTEAFQNYVTKAISKVECRIKVLGYPVENIKSAYVSMVDEELRTAEDLTTILKMKGVSESNYKNLIGNFISGL